MSWLKSVLINQATSELTYIPLTCEEKPAEKSAMTSHIYWPCSRRTTTFIALFLLFMGLAMVATKPSNTRFNLSKYQASLIIEPSAERGINWSQYAYTQYVTDLDYLCNSVMLFETLERLGSKADRVMMYPDTMHSDNSSALKEAELLHKAQKEYNVKLVPIRVLRRKDHDSTWAESYTKLLAFNQTGYKRVLNLDSDATILKIVDELFLLPSSPVAMPRAYWGTGHEAELSSQVLLVEPSEQEFARVTVAIESAGPDSYDMDIMNDLYADTCMILPHRPYSLLTGELRSTVGHRNYLGNWDEPWDVDIVLGEAKYLHFSDWPVPKPWIEPGPKVMEREQPKCIKAIGGGEQDCGNQKAWRGFYENFRHRRKRICGLDLSLRETIAPPPREPLF